MVGPRMKVALLQARGTPADVPANVEALRRAAADAATAGAGLLVTPEAFVTGYDIATTRMRELAEPAGGEALAEVGRIAAAAGVAIVCGWAERDGECIYNAATLFDARGGTLLTHRKAHLYGDIDRASFAPGDRFAVADLDGLRVGILICFDIEFPEPARALALAGAQLIAVPTSLMAPYDFVAHTIVPARAAENQLFVAYANRVGRETTLDYVGQSCVASPDGQRVAVAGRDEQTLLVAEVDTAAIDASRAGHNYLDERRPSLYGTLVE